MNTISRGLLALLLSPFVFSFAFSMDIYIPVVPEMRQTFHTSQFLIQMTLSLFVLGIGIGEIFLGPLSDQFGRIKIIFVSIFLFIVGAIGCAVSTNITMLIIARVICAVGSCGMLVVAFAIVRDLYSEKHSAQLYSWLNAAIGISPTFAPIIGGYLGVNLGWRAVFWFLGLIGIVAIGLTLFFIKETLPQPKRAIFNWQVMVRYKMILQNRAFIRYLLFAGFGMGICFAFFSVSPFIIINLLHIKQQNFGYYFAAFGLAGIVGSLINGNLVNKIGVDKSINYGIILMFCGGTLMLLSNLVFGLYLSVFLITMAISCIGAVFCIGSAAAGAMEPFPEFAGTAASALQGGQFIIAAIIGSALMYFPVTSSISYAICILLIAIASLITLLIKM